jgi:predicted RNA binding protein YcfA (HicA-like mRNA interferase family)
MREMIWRLLADGWQKLPSRGGNHRQFIHPLKNGRVTVPDHGRLTDRLGKETWKSIVRQAQWSDKS